MTDARERIIVVVRKTRLDVLRRRFNTRAQAKFYLEHNKLDFADYDREHDTYEGVVTDLRKAIAGLDRRVGVIDRDDLPNFLFESGDIIVTVGQDGLVVNAAKYLKGQPVIAVNPDPARFDGVLLPYRADTAIGGVKRVLAKRYECHEITMAEAVLTDGQRLLAFNDFLIGQRSHVSARYQLRWRGRSERQSSSGVLISTGAGSTGWLSSTRHMAMAVERLFDPAAEAKIPVCRMTWDDPRLAFVVREPFASRSSGVELAAGWLEAGEELHVESFMPDGGVIFSDGVEADALAFNSGAVAVVRTSDRRTRLVKA